MPFEFKPFPEMPDVVLVEPKAFGDDRGWFMETFKESDFAKHGIAGAFRQDNHSRSTGKHTLRGLHYQTEPMAQGKLVRCPLGEILDVAVDIRKGSPTFGKHVSAVLSAENRRMLWVPPGFAHGVLTLTDVADVMYKCTNEYAPANDRSIRWNDPQIAFPWPTTSPLLSKKDAEAPFLKDANNNFTWSGNR